MGAPRRRDVRVPPGERRVVREGFHERVFAVVRLVPPGRVTTYGQVATLLGSPRVARHVGWAMSSIPEGVEPVPWHRVINAQGRISHRGDLARAQRQRELLEREGVHFDARERVSLREYAHDFAGFDLPADPEDPSQP